MTARCPECNHKGGHAAHCRAGIDESRPMTSAERYFSLGVGDGDVVGPAAPPYGRSPAMDYLPWAEAHNAEKREELKEWSINDLTPGDLLPTPSLPTSALARKELPLATGLLDYFPAALVAVAGLSRVGNEQHNPGKPLAWDRAKSGDEADALLRHFLDRGLIDTDGLRHSTKVAWRALALLQKELEAAGLAPLSRGSR